MDVAGSYVGVADGLGYPLATTEEISLAGITASWAPADEKTALRARFLAEFDQLRSEYGLPARAAS